MRVWIALLPLFLLASCAGSKSGGSDEQGMELVTYHRTGGIAALDDVLVVRENGKLSVKDKYGMMKWVHVATANVKQLKSILESRGLAALKGPYTSTGAVMMTHVSTIPSGQQVMG